ncbi:TPA: EexN family lipoprotein [Campylobacter jejuni]|nr:EexN family lipoprotein [Campylobacter jejuni]HED0647247.1 EexN family lipoprotein [Campylobacter jejuni]HED0700026.1 EexN family lipoprotein [Campylobacter jejuni]HED0957048.1 EexN family lipoprotein [Campylobacter jejuni]HEG8370860.1 EexN family lipoprotein [Campylobacter jejuni]
MKNTIKLALLGAVITGVFSACSSEPKTVQYYEDPKNATELEAKIKECDKNANSAQTDTECANASSYSKSFNYKPQVSTKELMEQVEKI